MFVTDLELHNFRNYEHQEIRFSPEKNIIIGMNAQGKTNLLEAFYFLSHQKTTRSPRLRELLKEGEETASVRAEIIDGGERIKLEIRFSEKGRAVEVNGQRVERIARAKGILKCVMFSPDDLYMVKGEPEKRREFLDEIIEETSPILTQQLLEYRRILKQRNAALKTKGLDRESHERLVDVWNELFVKNGASLITARERITKKVSEEAATTYGEISGRDGDLEVWYEPSFEVCSFEKEEIERRMREELRSRREEEARRRRTLIGPHRDDIRILMDGRAARGYASQGEQRSIAFALRIAQRKFIEEKTGKTPVTLFDDVFSELDQERRAKVLEIAGKGSQAIITTTELFEDLEANGSRVMTVSNGEVHG